jgi:hypothetical protein
LDRWMEPGHRHQKLLKKQRPSLKRPVMAGRSRVLGRLLKTHCLVPKSGLLWGSKEPWTMAGFKPPMAGQALWLVF